MKQRSLWKDKPVKVMKKAKKTKTEMLFENAVAHLGKLIPSANPKYNLEYIAKNVSFEYAVFMLWVACRIQLYDKYSEVVIEEETEKFLASKEFRDISKETYTPNNVAEVVKEYGKFVAPRMSSLKQALTSIRGGLFERCLWLPLHWNFSSTKTPVKKNVEIAYTGKNKDNYRIDISVLLDGAYSLGISIKGNVRERGRESLDTAATAVRNKVYEDVWHAFLTSGDPGDEGAIPLLIREAKGSPQIYTWSGFAKIIKDKNDDMGDLKTLEELHTDITSYLQKH